MPGFREAARAPTPARSGPRPARPIPWQVVHWPLPRKTCSPAATSCWGVTFPPSSDSSSGGLDSIWGIEFAYHVYPPITASAKTPTRTGTGTAMLRGTAGAAGLAPPGDGQGLRLARRRTGRRVAALAQAAEPEDEHDHQEEDDRHRRDHVRRVAERRGHRVRRAILH